MKLFYLIIILFPVFTCASSYLGLETGTFENSYNKVSIPGDSGSRINLAPSFDDSNSYYRLSFSKIFRSNYGVRFLFAPLELSGERSFQGPVSFNGQVFSAQTKTDTFFKFNSYRGTYFYQIIDNQKWLMRVGGTVKIRDAEISLKQGLMKKTRKDLGVVPLFYLYTVYHINEKFHLTLDFDGLVAPQGRAIDSALFISHDLPSDFSIGLGYRILEGGADNDKVYTFSQFNYFLFSVSKRF